MDRVVKQTELNMEYFGTRFPWPAAKQGTYEIIDNIGMDRRLLDRSFMALLRVHQG